MPWTPPHQPEMRAAWNALAIWRASIARTLARRARRRVAHARSGASSTRAIARTSRVSHSSPQTDAQIHCRASSAGSWPSSIRARRPRRSSLDFMRPRFPEAARLRPSRLACEGSSVRRRTPCRARIAGFAWSCLDDRPAAPPASSGAELGHPEPPPEASGQASPAGPLGKPAAARGHLTGHRRWSVRRLDSHRRRRVGRRAHRRRRVGVENIEGLLGRNPRPAGLADGAFLFRSS